MIRGGRGFTMWYGLAELLVAFVDHFTISSALQKSCPSLSFSVMTIRPALSVLTVDYSTAR